MLQRLYIRHYALIEQLDIDFTDGFSVITGETGAGKSIMLGALGLLLGGRADSKAIGQGAQKCCVEATFDVDGPGVEALLQEADIDFDGHECIVRREVTVAGKSRAFVNDTPVQLSLLKRLGSYLIDIHSQHRNLLLGEENFLIETLDTIGGHNSLVADYRSTYGQWNAANKELQHLRQQAQQGAADADYLRHQLQLIEDAALTDGEQEELEQESETLSHAEDIKTAFYQASTALRGDENVPLSALQNASHALQGVQNVYRESQQLMERLDSLRIELDDIADEVERICDSLEFDPARLEYVDDRLATIYGLQKRFQVDSIALLLEKAENLRTALGQIDNSDELITRQEKLATTLHAEVIDKGKALTEARRKAGNYICDTLCRTLLSMGMPSATLQFDFTERNHPEATGLENVSLLFSGNKNVSPQDVAQIASGGETARLMLSLKALIASHRHLPTIVFDEIDTGVSGRIAERMAQVMQEISSHCQVLCITHLPQIAALGSRHYRVQKSEDDRGTTSQIHLLSDDERIHEIANMLSGEHLTDAAIDNAKSLLHIC